MAAAAAIAGETKCVRAPLPWRPSKLRLLVDAQCTPAGTGQGSYQDTLNNQVLSIQIQHF